jgi:hypothetical protein
LKEKADNKLKAQMNYDKSAKDLKRLKIGCPVLLRTFHAAKGRWAHGKVLEQLSDRSYSVFSEPTGNIVRRNRVDLKEVSSVESAGPSNSSAVKSSTSDESLVKVTNDTVPRVNETRAATNDVTIDPEEDAPDNSSSSDQIYHRPKRIRKLPSKFKDFVMG